MIDQSHCHDVELPASSHPCKKKKYPTTVSTSSSLRTMGIGSIRLDKKRARLLSREIQQIPSLRFDEVTFLEGALQEVIKQGLETNANLKRLSLSGLDQKDLCAILLQGLYPSLQELDISENDCHGGIFHALGSFLEQSNNNITILRMNSIMDDANTNINVTLLAQALSKSRSLRHLELRGNGLVDSDADTLFQLLPECLETLVLRGNRLETLDFPTYFSSSSSMSFTATTTKRRLRVLDLRGNPIIHENCFCDNLFQILQTHPALGRIILTGYPINKKEDDWKRIVLPLMQRNRSGERVLLGEEDGIPLSIWPHVLERVNRLEDWGSFQKANAIYHLLQGPCLMTRAKDLYV